MIGPQFGAYLPHPNCGCRRYDSRVMQKWGIVPSPASAVQYDTTCPIVVSMSCGKVHLPSRIDFKFNTLIMIPDAVG